MAQCYFRAIVEKSIIYYVSITLPPPLLRALTGMIPRHTRVSPAPVAATATPLSLSAQVSLRDLIRTSLDCNYCWGFTSLDPAFWFRCLVSLAFDSLLVPRSDLTEFRCIKVWWPPPHPECWQLKFTFGQSLAMCPFARHLLQSPPRCATFLFCSCGKPLKTSHFQTSCCPEQTRQTICAFKIPLWPWLFRPPPVANVCSCGKVPSEFTLFYRMLVSLAYTLFMSCPNSLSTNFALSSMKLAKSWNLGLRPNRDAPSAFLRLGKFSNFYIWVFAIICGFPKFSRNVSFATR